MIVFPVRLNSSPNLIVIQDENEQSLLQTRKSVDLLIISSNSFFLDKASWPYAQKSQRGSRHRLAIMWHRS
jgi:hypothetical protein